MKHGLVPRALLSPWCSASWFERTATPAQVKTIYALKTNQLTLRDDYEVPPVLVIWSAVAERSGDTAFALPPHSKPG